LATTAVSLEPQAGLNRTVRLRQARDRSFAPLLVSAMTLFAVVVGGYHPLAEDGGLYMAGIKRLLDSSLYPWGTSFVLEPARHSLFSPTIAAIVRAAHSGPDEALHTILPLVLLGLHLATVWAMLFAAWMLAKRCSKTVAARSGAVVLLACWLGLPVAGTALCLMDPYLTARSFSTPCMVLALVGALDLTELHAARGARLRGLALWAASLALAAAMHPLMAGYALGSTLLLMCLRSPWRVSRLWGTAVFSLAGLTLAALLERSAAPESVDYVRIAATRAYWYLGQWRWYELVGLAAPLAILALAGRRGTGAQSALARMAVIAGITSIAASLLFARSGDATHLVARMQPLRVFQLIYLLMVLVLGAGLGHWLGDLTQWRRLWRWTAVPLSLGCAMLLAQRATFPNSSHLEFPGVAGRNAWVQAFLWIRGNTPKNALFALDADYINAPGEDAQCFRAIAERSALPDYSKDGGEASIAPDLTGDWAAGQAAQQRLSAPATTDRQRLAALAPLGVTWVVLEAEARTDLDCPYANGVVSVCRLR